MSIIRIKKEREYVSIANAILQNKALTWEARGIMAYLLSKPDGWECRNYDLINQGPAGKTIIQRVLKELQQAGYIHRYQKSDGHKIEWITEIYETPELNTTSRNIGNLPADEPTSGKPAGRKPGDIVSTDIRKDGLSEKTDLPPSGENDFDDESFTDVEFGCIHCGEVRIHHPDCPKVKSNIKKSHSNVSPFGHGLNHGESERKQALNYLADQIATICQIDINMASKKARDGLKTVTVALYGKSANQDDLNNFKDWWYNHYWAGQKGQAPTPAQVGDTWGQFEAFEKEPQVKNHEYTPNLSEAQRARLAELTAQNK